MGKVRPAACKSVLPRRSINERLLAVAHPHGRSRHHSRRRSRRRHHHHSRCRWGAHGRERQRPVSSLASAKQQAMLRVHARKGRAAPTPCTSTAAPPRTHAGCCHQRRHAPALAAGVARHHLSAAQRVSGRAGRGLALGHRSRHRDAAAIQLQGRFVSSAVWHGQAAGIAARRQRGLPMERGRAAGWAVACWRLRGMRA